MGEVALDPVQQSLCVPIAATMFVRDPRGAPVRVATAGARFPAERHPQLIRPSRCKFTCRWWTREQPDPLPVDVLLTTHLTTSDNYGTALHDNSSVARVQLKPASRDTVAKLRLGGAPTPRSWVARMTKRPAPHRCG